MAGLRWQPEMCPMAKAMVKTVSPNAKATPIKPMPTAGNAPANTAAPHPPKTSQNVPKNSAAARLPIGIRSPEDLSREYRLGWSFVWQKRGTKELESEGRTLISKLPEI